MASQRLRSTYRDSRYVRAAKCLEGVTVVTKNPKANQLFSNAKNWVGEANLLGEILLECNLTEEINWRGPCYANNVKTICIVQRMAGLLSLLFFRRALLQDPNNLLEPKGLHSRAG